MNNLLVGNGVNIQFGGYDFSTNAIMLRMLKSLTSDDFPSDIIVDEPLDLKCYIGKLFAFVPSILLGDYDEYATNSAERNSLNEFKERYNNKHLKITDIGFEDYYLISDICCHSINRPNQEIFKLRQSLCASFIHAIYDNDNVNKLSVKYPKKFKDWLGSFDNIFTTNYDQNIDNVYKNTVFHLHGDFNTRDNKYMPNSFLNQLPNKPIDGCLIDEKYSHIYSTCISTHSGSYKAEISKRCDVANDMITNSANNYNKNEIKIEIDSWKNSDNRIVQNLYSAIKLKVENPEMNLEQQYPIGEFKNMNGSLTILGLSPFNDRHIFEMIDNNTNLDECIYYYYYEFECEVIKSLITSKKLVFESAKKFWGSSKNKKTNKKVTKSNPIYINENELSKYLTVAREMTSSSMNNHYILKSYNSLTKSIKIEISNKVTNIPEYPNFENDKRAYLRIIDFHIIAEEYNIDPATVLFISICSAKNFQNIIIQ